MTNIHFTYGSGVDMWSRNIQYFKEEDEPPKELAAIASEYYVEYHKLPEVVLELWEIRDKFSHLVSFSEFRPLE